MYYRNHLFRISDFFRVNAYGGGCYLDDPRFYYTGFARNGLLCGIDVLNIQKGDNVIVPDYICRAAIAPFILKGVAVKYYSINKDFSFNNECFNDLIDKKTKAVMSINYFGIYNNADICFNICRQHNIFLIEDNAHALFLGESKIKGDIALFSFRKFYPLPNGALLFIKNNGGARVNLKSSVARCWGYEDYKFIAQTAIKKLYSCLNFNLINKLILVPKDKNETKNYDNNFIKFGLSKEMLKLSFGIIKRINPENIFNVHRDNYNFLLSQIKFLKCPWLKIPFDNLGKESCPMAFPLIVEKERKYFIDRLFVEGFVSYPWPDLPGEIVGNPDCLGADYLSKTILLLPIHQDMGKNSLQSLAEVLATIADEVDKRHYCL